MATITVTASCNSTTLTAFANGDTLVINNGATVTVDTNQTKFWKTVGITNGTLLISNTSTVSGITFYMGRTSGLTENSITAGGLGSLTISGNWIEIGTGDGSANQSFTAWCSNIYIPCIWVESVSGSGNYEIWLNITSTNADGAMDTNNYYWEGLTGVSNGKLGNFFKQTHNAEPYASTASMTSHYTGVITVGDGTYGNVVPVGCKVRVPNIAITDATACNIIPVSYTSECSYNFSSGGSFYAENAYFDQSYMAVAQPSSFILKNVGISNYLILTECYNTTISSLGIGIQPIRRCYISNAWSFKTFTRWGYRFYASNVTNGIFSDIHAVAYGPGGTTFTQDTGAIIRFRQSDSVSATKIYGYNLIPFYAGHNVIGLNYIYNSTFNDIRCVGGGIGSLYCSGNSISGVELAETFQQCGRHFIGGFRSIYDPSTSAELINGTTYYLKGRAYNNWADMSEYVESDVGAFVPYAGTGNHPFYLSTVCSASESVKLDWIRVDPTLTTTSYEIYRSTDPSFTARTSAERVCGLTAAATITYTNGPRVAFTATTGNTISFTAATSAMTRSAGSFITDGWTVGDVFTVTNTTNNNGTYTVFRVVALTLTVREALVNEAAKTSGVILNDKRPSNDTWYYYVFRKYDSAGVYTESLPQPVYVLANAASGVNYCLQNNDFSNASWTKTNVTVTTNQWYGPEVSNPQLGIATLDSLAATGNATVTQVITGLSPNTVYSLVYYARSLTGATIDVGLVDNASTPVTSTTTHAITMQKMTRFTHAITTGAAASQVTITFGYGGTWVSGETIQVGAVNFMNLPTSAIYGSIATTTAPVTVTQSAPRLGPRYLISKENFSGLRIDAWRHYGFPNYVKLEYFLGTTSGFTPSLQNKIGQYMLPMTTLSTPLFWCTSMNNTVVRDVSQIKYGGVCEKVISFVSDCSNNKFINLDFDMSYHYQNYFLFNTGSFNNVFHNIDMGRMRGYVSTNYPFSTANDCIGYRFQNIRASDYDMPYNPLACQTVIKGMAGAKQDTVGNRDTTMPVLGSGTTDNMVETFQSVYDTIFSEFYHSVTTGAIQLLFTKSQSSSPPYTVLSGNPTFDNTGKLYFMTPNDSIVYTWPHKIYGISGFRKRPMGTTEGSYVISTTGSGLGTDNQLTLLLKKEYAISTDGITYGSYKEVTTSNLTGEVVSATAGFYFKLKLSARPGIAFDGQTSEFVVGETVNGQTSGATAVVEAQEDGIVSGAAGTLALSAISGTFVDNENIRSGVTVRAVVNMASGTAWYPYYNSYINGIEIFTTVDQSVMYPISNPNVILTDLALSSEVRIYKVSDNSEIGGIESCTSSTVSLPYEYFGTDFDVNIVIMSLGYEYLKLENITLSEDDIEIPIVQNVDRNYYNP